VGEGALSSMAPFTMFHEVVLGSEHGLTLYQMKSCHFLCRGPQAGTLQGNGNVPNPIEGELPQFARAHPVRLCELSASRDPRILLEGQISGSPGTPNSSDAEVAETNEPLPYTLIPSRRLKAPHTMSGKWLLPTTLLRE
jgi:hypothetical protein